MAGPGGKYFDVYVSGGAKNEVAIYDSEANELSWLCDTGPPPHARPAD